MAKIKESVIGFRLGDYKSGSNEVVAPFCCRHIPEVMKSFIRVGFTGNWVSLSLKVLSFSCILSGVSNVHETEQILGIQRTNK